MEGVARVAGVSPASIGLIIEDVSNPFFSAVHRGVEDVARARSVLTFVGSSEERPERERELVEAFAARGVDGLVIVPCGDDQSYLLRDHQAGTALVFVDRPPRLISGDAVVSDNAGGARRAVEHLLAAGHRRIAFLGDRLSISTAHERRAGYRQALGELPRLECPGLTDSDHAEWATLELLRVPEAPTALFTSQNLITIGAIRALRGQGRQHEVAMVSFDDVALGSLVQPGITVVAQDPRALGRRAAEQLFRRLAEPESAPQLVVIPTRLVPRGSGEIAP